MRTITYSYDGLQRLIGAVEPPGSRYAYQYDVAGNRTDVTTNGTLTQHRAYDAANQLQSGTYDAAGNLLTDGSGTYRYDALGRLTAGTGGAQGSTYSYNGDGTLVGQAGGGVTTGYAQDLAGGQSQVLAITTGAGAGASTTDQLWGLDRLASLNPATGTRAWYGYDGQGSARQLLNDAGHVTASANYDPYGSPEGAALPSPFGYTGELTDPATGSQYLRARWYRPGQGSLLGVDPALDNTGQPYSYANDNPANGSDPSGQCTVHLAGTEYSYLGAYGLGPCPRDFASQIGAVFRQGHGIPCLYVTPTGGLEVLAPGQTQTNSEPPPSGGGAGTAALAIVGAGAIAVGQGAFEGAEAGSPAGPGGALVVGIIGAAIALIVFVAARVTSATSEGTDPSNKCGQVLGTLIIGGYCVGRYSVLTDRIPPQDKVDADGVTRQAHHIIQDKAVDPSLRLQGIQYSTNRAPAILLRGGTDGSQAHILNPEHALATQPQRYPCTFNIHPTWGRYGVEREIAYKGLRRAGISAGISTLIVAYADTYFNGILVTPQTRTGLPAGRPSQC